MVSARRPLLALLLLAGIVTAWLVATPPGRAQPPPAGPTAPSPSAFAGMPALAIVLTDLRAGASALHFASAPTPTDRAGRLGPAEATLQHRAGGSIRAALLADARAVVVTAPVERRAEISFDSVLFALRPGESPTAYCDRVVHASSPLVTASGRIVVSRGRAGPDSDPAAMRVDELTIDEIDATSGAVRTIYSWQGYLTHLAGRVGEELIVYRVGPGHADLVAISLSTAAAKPVVPTLLPFARDFSVDESRGRLLWRNRHETDTRRWVVEELDLRTGAQRRLLEDRSFALAPSAWPDGGLAANPAERGLRLFGSADRIAAPLGAGVDRVRAVSRDGRFVALVHTAAGESAAAFVVDRAAGAWWRVPTSTTVDAAVAGFVERSGGAP